MESTNYNVARVAEKTGAVVCVVMGTIVAVAGLQRESAVLAMLGGVFFGTALEQYCGFAVHSGLLRRLKRAKLLMIYGAVVLAGFIVTPWFAVANAIVPTLFASITLGYFTFALLNEGLGVDRKKRRAR